MVSFMWNVRVLKYNQMKSRHPIPAKRHSPRTIASIVLGVISIISASIALIMTIGMYFGMKAGQEGIFILVFLVPPLMLISFIISIIGICLSSGTLKGKWLNNSGLMLTFSPILMVIMYILYLWLAEHYGIRSGRS